MCFLQTSTDVGDPNPASVDSHDSDLAEHVHKVQDWLNNGALISIRCAEGNKRAAMLDELAAVLRAAAVSSAHEACAAREAMGADDAC